VARETLGEIDQLIRALREDDVPEERNGRVEPPLGLAALESLVERHRSTGLAVDVSTSASVQRCSEGRSRQAGRR
jgi:hypothetical protein